MNDLRDTTWARALQGQTVASTVRVSDGDTGRPWVALYRGENGSWAYARMTPETHGIGIVEGPRAAVETAAQADGEWRRLFVPDVAEEEVIG